MAAIGWGNDLPKRYYVILYNEHQMIVPIKSQDLRGFLPGCPQFFGGRDKGGLMRTLLAEVREESRRTIALHDIDDPAPFYQEDLRRETLRFYKSRETALPPEVLGRWGPTGVPWGDPQNNDEEDMQAIRLAQREAFQAIDRTSFNAVMNCLGQQTDTVAACNRGDFRASATAQAFHIFIRDYWR